MKCSLPLIVLLVVTSSSYLSTYQSVRGVFFFPNTSQYVGVIFNHNSRNCMRARYLQLNNVLPLAVARTMCHVGTKNARPFIAPSSEPQWRLTLTEPPRPYFTTRR